jgi:hypothetical protein
MLSKNASGTFSGSVPFASRSSLIAASTAEESEESLAFERRRARDCAYDVAHIRGDPRGRG